MIQQSYSSPAYLQDMLKDLKLESQAPTLMMQERGKLPYEIYNDFGLGIDLVKEVEGHVKDMLTAEKSSERLKINMNAYKGGRGENLIAKHVDRSTTKEKQVKLTAQFRRIRLIDPNALRKDFAESI